MGTIILATLSAVFAALVAILGKIGLQGVDSTLATTMRAVIMALFLFVTSLALGKLSGFGLDSFTQKTWIFIALSGVAGALSWLFYFAAIQGGTTTTVVALDKLSIVFVVVLAGFFLGEGFTWSALLGALLMGAGALLISLKI